MLGRCRTPSTTSLRGGAGRSSGCGGRDRDGPWPVRTAPDRQTPGQSAQSAAHEPNVVRPVQIGGQGNLRWLRWPSGRARVPSRSRCIPNDARCAVGPQAAAHLGAGQGAPQCGMVGVQQASDYGEEVEVAHQLGCVSTRWTRDTTECSGIPGVNERLAGNHG